VRQEGLGKLKKFIHLIGYQTRDLPVCSFIHLLKSSKENYGSKSVVFAHDYYNVDEDENCFGVF
jgi:hypothetical protein